MATTRLNQRRVDALKPRKQSDRRQDRADTGAAECAGPRNPEAATAIRLRLCFPFAEKSGTTAFAQPGALAFGAQGSRDRGRPPA